MKKIFFILACVLTLIGCEGSALSSKKPSEGDVLTFLPGTWKVTQVVDEMGAKTDFSGEAVFVFGKQESSSDFGSNHSSSLWGYATLTEDGVDIVNHGTWNIEPVDEDKGVFFYCQDGTAITSFHNIKFFMITSINGSLMRWEETESSAGFILSRVK